ncbi:MAG TPA: aminotransferase class I/II-fold pyridoxal phosphate-dependent enzyme [Gemmatimonadaceae bacterium]|nr:aminotransferase class I/II-fold pyridoxal phosphate-dependent enzyme [Gemmatimonadaceae bacterium]
MPPSAVAQHPLDEISLGLIVQIRERLLKAQAVGKKVYRLESGDPSFSVPPHVLEAVNKAGAAGKTHYIPNSGIPELRKALAEKVVRKNGLVGITDEDIFLTNGAMHALYVAFGALLSPGDEVILPDPMWTEVAENIRLAGGVTVGVPLRADHDFEYDTAEIEAAITPRTTAIFLNTPQNPTGAVLSEQTLREIADIAKRHDLWLVSDEAYEDVIYEPHKHFSIGSLVPEHAEKTISIFSFSKSYAMSGLRTGYIVTKSPLLHDRIPKLLRCTINGVNSLAQWAALAAVTGDQSQLAEMRAEYLVRRDALIAALSSIEGVRPFTPGGAFYVWAELDPSIYQRLGVADAAELSDKLAAIGIGSAPGVAFGQTCDDAIRFAYSCATPMVKEGAEAVRRALTDPDVLHGRKPA